MTDKTFPSIIYLPECVTIDLNDRNVCYKHPETGADMVMKIKNDMVYLLPNGY